MLSSHASLCRILRNTKSNHNAQVVCFKSTVANLPRWNNEKGGEGSSSSSSSGIDTSFSSSSSAHLETCLERFQPVIEKHSKAVASSNNVTTPTTSFLPRPLSPTLRELVERAPFAVKERSDKAIPPGAEHDPLMHLFRQYELTPEDWSPYAFFDSSRSYTRNLIATDDETYSLLLLCWNPQKESLIHDHPGEGCWLKVLQGSIQEARYSDTLECQSDEIFTEGQVGWITDALGYHKIGNPSMDQPAVTIHLYAPPTRQCRTWRLVPDPSTAASTNKNNLITTSDDKTFLCQKCTSTHYSEYGVPLKKKLG